MLVVEVVSKTCIQVIHYRTADHGKAVVCEEMIILDPSVETVEVITYSAKTDMYSAAEAISRARSRVGEEEYHLFNNNCESMVNWALTGEAISKQGCCAKLVLTVCIAAGIGIGFVITVGILTEKIEGLRTIEEVGRRFTICLIPDTFLSTIMPYNIGSFLA